MSNELIQKAIGIAGSQEALAERCTQAMDRPTNRPIRQAHISYWLRKAKRIPGEVAIALEAATEGQIPRWAIRPDLFRNEGATP